MPVPGVNQNGITRNLKPIGVGAACAVPAVLAVLAVVTVPAGQVRSHVLAVDSVNPVRCVLEGGDRDLAGVGIDQQELRRGVVRPAEMRSVDRCRPVGLALIIDLKCGVFDDGVNAVRVGPTIGLTCLATFLTNLHGVLTVIVLDGFSVRIFTRYHDVARLDAVQAVLVARTIEVQRKHVQHLAVHILQRGRTEIEVRVVASLPCDAAGHGLLGLGCCDVG